MLEFVTVEIPQGKLRGKKVTSSYNGVTYCSFQGIPYAKPPVGPLRFKPPEKPEPWTGIRDATIEGPISPQLYIFTGELTGEEDCLFLNVYTRQCSTSSSKAVMVWIHGGAFVMGSGNTDSYGPDFLIAEDIVLVTINYRLGALGFLYLEGADVTGNNGLRDQVMALKWVQSNIAYFGGDPDNVTIFGESAGGCSVQFLMISPLASGLVHRAIAQSGTVYLGGNCAPPEIANQRAVRLARLLGRASEDPQEVADFLRTVPAKEFVIHESGALSDEENCQVGSLSFFPSEEAGPSAFLPGTPKKLLNEGKFAKVPFMTGVTSAEGKVMLMDAFKKMEFSELDKEFEAALPEDIVREIGMERSKEMAKIIKKFYFGDRPVGDDTVAQYVDLMSDLMFVYPMHQTIRMHNKWSPHPTYVYLFDHMPVEVLPMANKNIPGTSHAAELPYLFKSTVFPTDYVQGSPDYHFSAKIVKLWTQFAKTGNPSNDEVNVVWTPTTKEDHKYLKINGGFTMESDMYKERMKFLDDLYTKFGYVKRTA